MASIQYKDKVIDVKDGDDLTKACEEVGVPFACHSGVCGSCRIEILEGEDNLTELSEMEQELGMSKTERFACQCKIKKGHVKFEY